MNGKYKITVIILLILGLIYRVWLGSLAQDKLVWDSMFYSSMASQIASGVHIANCCNIGPGYPLIVGLIYKIFGIDNITAVRIFQAVLDTATGLMIYLLARKVFNKTAGIISLIIYITNPFTSSYTGVILTEISALFVLVLAGLTVAQDKYTHKPRLWFVTGIILGLLVIIKMSFYQFIFLFTGFSVIFFIKKKKMLYLMMISVGFLISVSYAIGVNYITYGKLSPIPPYRTLLGPLFVSVEMDRAGELAGEPVKTSEEFNRYISEYYSLYGYDPQGLVEHDKSYKNRLTERLKTMWPEYIRHYIQNNIWMWDKYHLYVFFDPFHPQDEVFVRTLNVIYIILHLIGIIFFISSGRNKIKEKILVFSILVFMYVSGVYPIFNSETRLSLPYYPFIFLWAGYGLYRIIMLPLDKLGE